ncbi:NB-ARC domain-containing protein (plasmid) [Streptomyces sp. NBC_01351]|uniref:AfsR/SARP family transcriptional regulator n=1 Tax=Streptomyces sp. NBC_01351 TaxID=2903833 RepID=UPI002E3816A7|nr:BTAD domain-containing putative transcriptional regulator [Streptomyces sp. NBC_01351]
MDLQLLGPVEATREGARIALAGTKMHTVLAALLLARGRVVPDTRLSLLLWGGEPPATMSAQLHTYVSRLRKLLEPEVTLERRSPGYVIRTGDSRLDIVEFERLDRLGRQALQERRYDEAGTLLRDALELWQGPMLVNVTEHLAQEEVPQWEEGRAATLENRIEADLALGRHQEIVAELTRLVAEFPLRERMRAQLMTALYRCGRQADAFHVFHEGRSVLAEELGVEPGNALKAAHAALLRATLDLAPPGAEPGSAAARSGRPAGTAPAAAPPISAPASISAPAPAPAAAPAPPFMLPPDTVAFTGRGRELAALRRLLTAAEPRRCLITGMAGIGKTALAVHAAHAARADFPDGQLHADLAGPDGAPKDPRAVLVRFLRALGQEPPESAVHDLEELVRLYRTRTAGRRILVLLDNAADSAGLTPLLPAGPHCATLVTGHVHLAAATGPHTLALGPMNREESLDLLTKAVGTARTTAEPVAAEGLVDVCAGLPLALRIAGARLASRPHWSVARLAQRLVDERTRLDELSFGELDAAGALAGWLRRTDTETRELLARLSVLGGRPFSTASAATVLGLPLRRAEDLVESLADGSFLEPVRSPGRLGAMAGDSFRFHPLVLLHVQSLPVERPVRSVAQVAS